MVLPIASFFGLDSHAILTLQLQTSVILSLLSVGHTQFPNEEVLKRTSRSPADLLISDIKFHNYRRHLNRLKTSSNQDTHHDHYNGNSEEYDDYDEYQSLEAERSYQGRKAKTVETTSMSPEDVYDEFVKGIQSGGPEIEEVDHEFEPYDPNQDKDLKLQTTKAPAKVSAFSMGDAPAPRSRWSADNCDEDTYYLKHDEKDSKYFINRVQKSMIGKRNGSIQEIIDGCVGWGLVAAEIRHYDDYVSLMRQYKKTPEKPLGFPMNIKDNVFGTRGDWGYSNRQKLTFSAWHRPFPDNDTERFPEGESCATIKFFLYQGAPTAVWNDVACNDQIWKNAVQICQFPKGHVCYDKSSEEKAWKARDKKLFKVGTIGNRTYYSSFEQKNTFNDAFELCKASHYHLWEIPPAETKDEFFEMHHELIKKLDVHPGSRFWASAYVPDPLNKRNNWKLRQLNYNATYDRHAKEWAWWTHSQGYPSTVPRAEDKCISWYEIYTPVLNTSVFSLRAFPCDQPFFVYCISDPVLETDPDTGDQGFHGKDKEYED